MASIVQLVRGCLERFTVKLGRLWCHGILWCTWRDRCHRRGCTSPKFSANRSHLANPHSTLCLRATPAADPYRLGHCHDTEFASRLLSFSERSRWVLSFFQAANQARALTFGGKTRSTILPNGRLGPNHSHPPKKHPTFCLPEPSSSAIDGCKCLFRHDLSLI